MLSITCAEHFDRLVMMVMEKHRDIATLMSMGARLQQIRRIFVYEGALIGATGTAIGFPLGSVCHFADKYRWLKLNEQVYALSYVPFDSRWWWMGYGFRHVVSDLEGCAHRSGRSFVAPIEHAEAD
jgi:ABC-type lipoprotein release transport system permease subunit